VFSGFFHQRGIYRTNNGFSQSANIPLMFSGTPKKVFGEKGFTENLFFHSYEKPFRAF
jgi:hypothetical protein